MKPVFTALNSVRRWDMTHQPSQTEKKTNKSKKVECFQLTHVCCTLVPFLNCKFIKKSGQSGSKQAQSKCFAPIFFIELKFSIAV